MSIAMIPIKMGRFHILEMNKPYGSEIKYGIRSSMQKRKKRRRNYSYAAQIRWFLLTAPT